MCKCSVLFLFAVSLVLITLSAIAEDPTEPLSYSAFVDSYYLWSPDSPIPGDRSYTTQAARDEQPRINLASLGAKYDDGLFHAKITGQVGDSVRLNYAAEPQEFWQFIQEAYAGAAISEDTTVDVGVFLSHIGAEGWLSKDNINYTRSLIAEFSPYYEAGGKITHTFSDTVSGQLLLLNGWQNISEQRHPALGTQVSWAITKDATLIYNTFLGNESGGSRFFNDFIYNQNVTDSLKLSSSVDIGFQSRPDEDSVQWWGFSLMTAQTLSDYLILNGRFELYSDPHAAIATGINDQDFQVRALSVGLDIPVTKIVLVRGEIKHAWAGNPLFNDGEISHKDTTIGILSVGLQLS